MKLFSKSLLGSVAVLALSPLTALALPPDCDVRCTSSTPCDTLCAKPWAFEVMTCGEWVEVYGDLFPGSCDPGFSPLSEEHAASSTVTGGEADASEWVCREPAPTKRSQPVES